MKISLSIATYQRADYIERMSASLLASVNIEHVNVRIYDDCSPNWTIADLQGLFPYAKEIVRRSKNLKADANMKQIFEDFLSTDDDVLLLADSDLIYRSGWFDLLEEMLPATDGILSLYNSRLHPFEVNSGEESVIRDKIHLGAAGTAFTRDRVQDIVDANMEGINYDWAWSELFKKRGYRLMCVQESYIQHIGIIGQNNRGAIMHFDMARNFVADNLVTQKIMAIFLDELVEENNKFYQNLGIDENFLNMRIYDNNMQVNQPFCKNKWGGGIYIALSQSEDQTDTFHDTEMPYLNSHSPLLSVIVPVYNVEAYLSECLDSILQQTYPHLDIILIDDGSTDNSGVICDQYKEIDNRVRVIHKSNGGLSSARNVGMEVIKGDYVTFLDSDDWLEPDAYQQLMSPFLTMPQLDVVRGEYQEVYVDTDTKSYIPFRNEELVLDGDKALEALCRYDEYFWPVVWSSVYKVSSLKGINLKFQEGLLHEDEFFTTVLYGCCKDFQILYLPAIVVNYRRNRDGAITNQGRTVQTLRHLLIGFNSVYDAFNKYAPHKLAVIHTYIYYTIRHITLQLLSKDITTALPKELSEWRVHRRHYSLEKGVSTFHAYLFIFNPRFYHLVFKGMHYKSAMIDKIKRVLFPRD